jgi:flavin-dependent dehydrogenase
MGRFGKQGRTFQSSLRGAAARLNTFDAIVIGAGPAGSTAALCLARAGWSVAIVEKAAFPRRKVCGEFISAPTFGVLAGLGIAENLIALAGPEVREVALYANDRIVVAPMPRAPAPYSFGRALSRERLDTLLLLRAREAGAVIWQPFRVRTWTREQDGYVCALQSRTRELRLRAGVLIAAHGSWDTGRSRVAREASDLIAFKAHFGGGALPPGRMPLLAFPGGYGGLVQTDQGRTSFSCCIHRSALAASRSDRTGGSAGAAVLEHARRSCAGLREALAGAVIDGEWLAAGPLRVGVRSVCGNGYFAVGNALGEAHPIVAEGISMAIQSACLLTDRLIDAGPGADNATLSLIASRYEAQFRANFSARMRWASLIAAVAMRPRLTASAIALFARAPGLLDVGARWAGKARALRVAS